MRTNTPSFPWMLSRPSLPLAVSVTLALTVLIAVSASGCGTAPFSVSSTTRVVSSPLFALSQTGELAGYHAMGAPHTGVDLLFAQDGTLTALDD